MRQWVSRQSALIHVAPETFMAVLYNVWSAKTCLKYLMAKEIVTETCLTKYSTLYIFINDLPIACFRRRLCESWPSVSLSVYPSELLMEQPVVNLPCVSRCLSVREIWVIIFRIHGSSGRKFCKMMYSGHPQNGLDVYRALLVFIILALFLLSETRQIPAIGNAQKEWFQTGQHDIKNTFITDNILVLLYWFWHSFY